MFDSRLRHSFAMLSTFKERFEGMLFDTIIHINVKLKESAVMGKSVSTYDKYCRGSKDYHTLARELISLEKARAKVQPQEPQPAAAATSQPVSERMKELVAKETKELLPTRFSIEAKGAKSVYVTGSFNDWSLDDSCRLKEVNGKWEADIVLHPGVYKYQFIVDGVWKEDPRNPKKERNSFGDINSIVEVKTHEEAAAQ